MAFHPDPDMTPPLSRRHCLALATAGWLGSAQAQVDGNARPSAPSRSKAEVARQLSVPPPPEGVTKCNGANWHLRDGPRSLR
jgi:hypothetical protein